MVAGSVPCLPIGAVQRYPPRWPVRLSCRLPPINGPSVYPLRHDLRRRAGRQTLSTTGARCPSDVRRSSGSRWQG